MGFRRIGPAAYAAAGLAAAALLLTACGGGSSGGSSASGGASPAASGAVGTAPSGGPGATTAEFDTMCAQLKQFGDIKGKNVNVYTGIVAPEDTLYQKAFDAYTQCTGAKVTYEGDKTFEAQILVRVKAGNPPDIAIVPQPGLLKPARRDGQGRRGAQGDRGQRRQVLARRPGRTYGTVDGKFYAGPNSANVKSLVWYSPKTFTDNGWKIPTTLDELKTLSDNIAASGKMKPWCAGIGSGDATGWPVTDWMEDMMLRLYGAGDLSTSGSTTPSRSTVGRVDRGTQRSRRLPEERPSTSTVASATSSPSRRTTFQNGGLPILQKQVRAAPAGELLRNQLAQGHDGRRGRRGLRVLPPGQGPTSKPGPRWWRVHPRLLRQARGAGASRRSSSTTLLREPACSGREPSGGFVSANNGLLQTSLKTPIDQLTAAILQDPKAVFRFDGSDQMPAAVGSDAFWKQATTWITGQDTKNTVDKIEAAWPKS